MSYPHGSWSTKEEGGHGRYTDAPEAAGFQGTHYRRVPERGMVRQASSSPTSSLSGAMGDAHITNPQMGGGVPSGMAWSIPQGAYGQLADESSMSSFGPAPPTPASASPSGQFSLYTYQNAYSTPSYSPNPDPYPHHPPSLPSPTPFEQFAMQQANADAMARAHHGMSTPSPTSAGAMAGQMSMAPSPIPGAVPMGRAPRRSSSDEIRQLHQRIAELEADRDTALQRAHQLEQELARRIGGFGSSFASGSGALPSPVPTPTRAALPMALEENWRARTEARRQIFCSVNRAGNALCAWHDSRRERRAYPPRNAPPGVLNCGCTYEEALFEESLSRHGVGSYHPGESVRMDPALRNPLLQLLQTRYGYRDGDFDFDPVTQTWRDGEDAAHWKQKLASGAANARRNRGEDRR